MNNTRFATAIHIMTILAKYPNEWITSDWIAGSININPAIVRKEMGVLKSAGLIISRKGKDGGTQLAKNEDSITFAEIWLAVKNSETLGKRNNNPNPKCPVGKDINLQLINLFTETDSLVSQHLSGKTLKNFSVQFE